jgi:heme oxygenase
MVEIAASLPTLSQRLKNETGAEHERMHKLMEKAEVFSSKEKYAQFTLSQYYFQKEVEKLFEQDEVVRAVPDLEVRGRSDAALADLVDLNLKPQRQKALEQIGFPQALGWIYVSEGSTLGAAFLFKEAQKHLGFDAEFGARNLAAYPEGRMKVWKRFTQALDSGFEPAQQDLIIEGALDAFAYFGELLSNLDTLR